MASKKEIYISVDVESDGPIPGEYSMLALGAVAAATFDGKEFVRLDLDSQDNGFFTMMRPVTNNFVPEAVEVCKTGGIDRDELKISGLSPNTRMLRFSIWLYQMKAKYDADPVFIAYPLGFDWGFVYYYFEKYLPPENNPFGFSRHLDIKTLYAAKARVPVYNATKRQMPKELRSTRKHTHNPLDDAKEQAELFCNIWEWKK